MDFSHNNILKVWYVNNYKNLIKNIRNEFEISEEIIIYRHKSKYSRRFYLINVLSRDNFALNLARISAAPFLFIKKKDRKLIDDI